MDWQEKMNRAVDYIEENLAGEFQLEAAARRAESSVWEFQRIFSFIAHISLGEYIRRRKLALAAIDIQRGNDKIIDIALRYGYESPAAFSRAFGQAYGVSPSSARNEGTALLPYPRIAFQSDIKGGSTQMKEQNDMLSYSTRGYHVRENAPVYFTGDMERTCNWFRNVLGWYGDIVARNEAGEGTYGCVFDYPGELIVAHLTPFRGIHLFKGEAIKGVAGFLMVQGLDRLHQFVRENGWDQISAIERQPWGARECSITTIDGCILRFFETTP